VCWGRFSVSARRAATKFDRSRPADGQNGERFGLVAPELAALPSSRRTSAVVVCRICLVLPVMPARAAPGAGRSATGFPEQLPPHGDLGHLEGHVAAVTDDLGADLDQLLPQAGQRPRLRGLRHRQRPHEVAQVVGKSMKLKADGIPGEGATRQAGPFDRALALLDVLLASGQVVVEGDDARSPGRARLVTMKPTRGQSSPGCHSTLATTRRGLLHDPAW